MTICSRADLARTFLFAALLAGGCTGVDDSLGGEFIPEDQRMSSRMVTLGEDGDPAFIVTRLAQKDSLITSRSRALTLGSAFDPVMGHTWSEAAIQFLPGKNPVDTSYFGYNAVADSIYLNLGISAVSGKSLVDQSFTIYELTDTIGYYRTLYQNFDLGTISNTATPLFRFTHSGEGSVNVRLTPTAAGQAYMSRLVALGCRYVADTLFTLGGENSDGERFEGFRGLRIVPDAPKTDAAMYRFYTSATYSALTLYAHNYDEKNPANVRDTTALSYYFDDYSNNAYNTVSSFHRDYSTGTVDVSQVNFAPTAGNLTSTPEVATAHVQGMGGIYTQLTLTGALGERLAQLAEGMNIVVKNATVYFPLEDPRPPMLALAPARLGMYDGLYMARYIPDYDIVKEADQTLTLVYGGTLVREPGYYSMDITTLINWFVKGEKGYSLPYTIALTPDYQEKYNLSRVELKGSATPGYRVKLKLTYTLVP